MKFRLVALGAVVVLAGCAGAQQNVSPVSNLSLKKMCIVQNPRVSQAGFLDSLQLAIRSRGYEVQVVSPGAGPGACPQVAEYTANYQWDLALYLAYAEIKVYENQKQVGSAVYDARRVLGPSKFIKGDDKVNELVGQLFRN